MIKAIETRYAGCRFRSRLEARWAVLFDALGIKWEYEPEGFELPDGSRYLPDFKVYFTRDGDHHFWFEVKGPKATPQEKAKCKALADSTGFHCFVASGTMAAPSVKLGRKGRLEYSGALINGYCPDMKKGGGDPSFAAKCEALGESFLCGFYESVGGMFELDHLYVEEASTFSKDPQTTAVTKIQDDMHAFPCANFGQGRKYRSDRLQKAYAAARSARFEFGESGAKQK